MVASKSSLASHLTCALHLPWLSSHKLTIPARRFWEKYAPLAPYIVPTSDRYEDVKDRSPGLMHCIMHVLVAPRLPAGG